MAKTILVIDDAAQTLGGLVQVLQQWGYRVVRHGDPKNLEGVLDQQPELIF